MNREKLFKIRKEIEKVRRQGGVRASDLQRIARLVGRRLATRGKEPNWVSDSLPSSRPISIPDHGGRDMRRGTVRSILNDLEGDVDSLEALLEDGDDGESENEQTG